MSDRFVYNFDGTTGQAVNLRFVDPAYILQAGEFSGTADTLPPIELVAVANITDWYWIVNDTNPTTKVYSTASNGFVSNTAAAFLTWLAGSFAGSSFPIHGVTNNAGNARIELGSTSAIQTGQRFNFGPNGNSAITVVDGTHIDTTIAFAGWVAAPTMYGAAIVDTEAHLASALNLAAGIAYTSNTTPTIVSAANIALTNPMTAVTPIKVTAPGVKVILPVMNSPLSIPKGTSFRILNIGAAGFGNYPFTVYAQDGTTVLGVISNGFELEVIVTDNTTPNGIWRLYPRQTVPSATWGKAVGLRAANNAGSPNTKVDISCREVECASAVATIGGDTKTTYVNGKTCDISAAGPIINGRDQAAAFSSNSWVHFFAIAAWDIVNAPTIASASFDAPTLPTDYTHFTYLFSAFIDGSGHLETIDIGAGSVALNRHEYGGSSAGVRGWTMRPAAGQLLVGQAAGQDAAFKPASGDVSVTLTGAFTVTSINGVALGSTTATAGNLLIGSGSAWVTQPVTGDITITSGGVTTIGNAKVTNAKLDNMANATIKARKTAGAGVPEDVTLSDVLDFIGSAAQGDLLYRAASAWARLAAGTAGQKLKTQGTGANPIWITESIALQVFTANGTYTPTSGMTFALALGVAGGGGGGAVDGNGGTDSYIGGGGGAGSWSLKLCTAADIGASKAVTIGPGGNGGAAGTNPGSDGSDTSLGALLVAKGGKGGQYSSNAQWGFGGAGGAAGTGDFTPTGARGDNGLYIATATFTVLLPGGVGASGPFGTGGQLGSSSGNVAGGNGSGYGSGGAGGFSYQNTNNYAGGNGAAGALFVLEFINI